jgi:hypothetical protein
MLMMGINLSSQIMINPEVPKVGQETTVTFENRDDKSDILYITYRPNSQVEIKDSILINGNSIQWIPENAGVVNLTAGNSSKNVSVRFTKLSWSGIAVMLLAFFMLFGGAAFAFIILFKTDNEDNLDPTLMTDT